MSSQDFPTYINADIPANLKDELRPEELREMVEATEANKAALASFMSAGKLPVSETNSQEQLIALVNIEESTAKINAAPEASGEVVITASATPVKTSFTTPKTELVLKNRIGANIKAFILDASFTETNVNADSASGQPNLYIASTANLAAGNRIVVGYGTAREETVIISSVQAGYVVCTTNLTNTHTLVQSDTVKKCKVWTIENADNFDEKISSAGFSEFWIASPSAVALTGTGSVYAYARA